MLFNHVVAPTNSGPAYIEFVMTTGRLISFGQAVYTGVDETGLLLSGGSSPFGSCDIGSTLFGQTFAFYSYTYGSGDPGFPERVEALVLTFSGTPYQPTDLFTMMEFTDRSSVLRQIPIADFSYSTSPSEPGITVFNENNAVWMPLTTGLFEVGQNYTIRLYL